MHGSRCREHLLCTIVEVYAGKQQQKPVHLHTGVGGMISLGDTKGAPKIKGQ